MRLTNVLLILFTASIFFDTLFTLAGDQINNLAKSSILAYPVIIITVFAIFAVFLWILSFFLVLSFSDILNKLFPGSSDRKRELDEFFVSDLESYSVITGNQVIAKLVSDSKKNIKNMDIFYGTLFCLCVLLLANSILKGLVFTLAMELNGMSPLGFYIIISILSSFICLRCVHFFANGSNYRHITIRGLDQKTIREINATNSIYIVEDIRKQG